MPTKVEADLSVQRFGFAGDGDGKRLLFPHAEGRAVSGRTGTTSFGAGELALDDLVGHLDLLRWEAGAASIAKAFLRDDAGKIDVTAEQLELPRGVRLVRAETGVEILAHHVTLSDLALTVTGPFERAAPTLPAEERDPRQARLRFLDSLAGKISVTIKVVLDLPVLGHRTLDQRLEVPIQEGSLDYRALDKSLNWLEGQFLDIKHAGDKLAITWRVPIFGSSHDLISWTLDRDASALAAFGRVPVRSLTEMQLGEGKPDADDARPDRHQKKARKILESFTVDAIDVALSLLAPRNLEIGGGGVIMFGGEDAPGMVDLQVTGAVSDSGPGELRGRIGSIDLTIKDLRAGPIVLSADRLCLDAIDHVEVVFDGWKPVKATVHAHRVTATNLSLKIA